VCGFQLENTPKAFGSRAPPEPSGGAYSAAPDSELDLRGRGVYSGLRSLSPLGGCRTWWGKTGRRVSGEEGGRKGSRRYTGDVQRGKGKRMEEEISPPQTFLKVGAWWVRLRPFSRVWFRQRGAPDVIIYFPYTIHTSTWWGRWFAAYVRLRLCLSRYFVFSLSAVFVISRFIGFCVSAASNPRAGAGAWLPYSRLSSPIRLLQCVSLTDTTYLEELTRFSHYGRVFTTRCYAERGVATASGLSVRLSVCEVVSWSHRSE